MTQVTVTARRKNRCAKKKRFPLVRKSISTSRNESPFFLRFHKRQKKNYRWQKLMKNGEKMVSSSQKINLPLATISFFFLFCFLLIPIMVSTNSKIALNKKTASNRKKSAYTSRMKDIETYISIIRKNYFHFKESLKIILKMVSTRRIMVSI